MENKKSTKNNLVDGIYNNLTNSKLEKQDILTAPVMGAVPSFFR